MNRIIRANEVVIEDGYSRIVMSAKGAWHNNNKVQMIEPVYANLVPADHPAKPTAERLAKEWQKHA